MKLLEWNVQYSVGVPLLDKQHARLFSLAQRLTRSLNEKDILESTIDELFDYVGEHFRCEEAILEKVHYENLEEHRQVHKIMVTRLELLAGQLRQGILQKSELIAFLENWLTIHILGEDMKYVLAIAKAEPN